MVEHHLAKVGVAGSNPVFRSIFIKRSCRFIFLKTVKTTLREVAQLGRALGLGPRGRRFESCLPDFYNAGMAELADALESGSSVFTTWGFESLHPHFPIYVSWGLSSAGRAPALHAGGQRFDPASLHFF